jgi:hypothetical protein
MIWARRERFGSHHYGLGKGAVRMLAEHAELDTQALLAGKAVPAPAARQTGVEHDLGPELDTFDSVPHRIHHASAVGATDVGQSDRYAGHAVEDEEIEVIEGRGLQAHPDLSRPRFGLGSITVEQLVGPAVLFEKQGFHEHLP